MPHKKTARLALLITLVVLTHTVNANTFSVVILEPIGEWTNQQQTELGDQVWADYLNATTLSIETVRRPIKRGLVELANGRWPCTFSASKEEIFKHTGIAVEASNPVAFFKAGFITHKDTPKISNVEMLNGQIAAFNRGTKLQAYNLSESMFSNIYRFDDFSSAFQMLESKRIDVLVIGYIREPELPDTLHYDENFEFYSAARTLTCRTDFAFSNVILQDFNRFLESRQ